MARIKKETVVKGEVLDVEKDVSNETVVEGEVLDVEKDVPNETKAERFVRLSKARMPKVLKALSQIENLATSNYESTPDQQAKIIKALKSAVDRVQIAFDKPKKSADDLGFDFD